MAHRTPHHGRAPRLPGHDYRGTGWYFITLVTVGRVPLFRHSDDSRFALSPSGILVDQAWRKGLAIRAEVSEGPWVVMPDHFHALVGFTRPNLAPEQSGPPGGLSRPGRSLGSLIAGFKAASTGAINRVRGTPGSRIWQVGFYDRVVRDDRAWRQIARYIESNPARWVARAT